MQMTSCTVAAKYTTSEKQVGNFRKQLKVLLIEDSLFAQKLLLNQLAYLGCCIHLATDGDEALAAFSQGFDFVITDIELPKKNGLEIAREIREQEKGKHIPILAITTQADSKKNECFSAGIDEVISKGVSSETLNIIMQGLVKKFTN